MQFTFPSFINQTEQDDSRLLYNSVKIALQTHLGEIWYNSSFGTKIRDYVKDGIDALVITDIQQDIEDNLVNHFQNDIHVDYVEAWQDADTIKVNLAYTELRTGKHNTVKTEEKFANSDTSLY